MDTYFKYASKHHKLSEGAFKLENKHLCFHGIDLKRLIDKYGSPLRLIYLPKIGSQIEKARFFFQKAFDKHHYQGLYRYCYCTKCNHYAPVVCETLKHGAHLETSSAADIDLILNLHSRQQIDTHRFILHNGYKTNAYLSKMQSLKKAGFHNTISILDHKNELQQLIATGKEKIKIGIRMATSLNPGSNSTISRLGIAPGDIFGFYQNAIEGNAQFELKMFHFFVDSGMDDSAHYWKEFDKALDLFLKIKTRCTGLTAFNLGGGLAETRQSDEEIEALINKIVGKIKVKCECKNVSVPDIFTEFGQFTVAESGALLYKVIEQKNQGNEHFWYIIDNSLMTGIPDAYWLDKTFSVLPLNRWDQPGRAVYIGGLSCDSSDVYKTEGQNRKVILPVIDDQEETLYLGFFYTGAYQDAVSGYGGIKHCLIPSPDLLIIDRNKQDKLLIGMIKQNQSDEFLFNTLGYDMKA